MNDTPSRHLFLWEKALNSLCIQFQKYKTPFLSSLLIGFLAYGFTFTNKLPNHDDTYSLFIKGATFEFGRWGLEILERFFPNYSMPWIYGILSVFLLTITACVIISIFHIRNKLLQGLLAGCIVAYPSMTATFSYMFTASSYAMSILMAVIAVAFLQRDQVWSSLFALGCMVFSLSIYQSYIALTAGLLVLILIQAILEGKDITLIIRKGIGYVLFLGLSLLLYYAATLFINRIKHVQFDVYASSSMQVSIISILEGIRIAYETFFPTLLGGESGLATTGFSQVLHLLCLISVALLLPLYVPKCKLPWQNILLLAALILIFPLAVNCLYLFFAPSSIHTLTLYGFICVYVLAAVLADACLSQPQFLSQAALHILTLSMAVIIAVNIYTANRAALFLHLQYENTYAFYTSLATQLKMTPEFNENTKVAVIGWHIQPEHFETQFSDVTALTGVSALHPDLYSKDRFLQYYLGLTVPFPSEEENTAIAATEEFAQMPIYPYYGSVKMIGDTLVVKLS